MPEVTPQQLEKKEQDLKAKLADAGSLAPEKLRETRKQLRRAQRKRRKLAVDAARRAAQQPKKQAPAAEAKAEAPAAEAPAAEAPAAEAPAEAPAEAAPEKPAGE